MTFKCKYCQKSFVRETTLINHICEFKRRANDKDNKQNRIAYQSWLMFRRLTMANAKEDKSYDDFIKIRYYSGFMKLAKYIVDLSLENSDEFVKFIITNSIPMKDWTKSIVLEEFIKQRTKKEPVERAVERSILNMKAWAERTEQHWQDYFQTVATPDAVQDLIMGRISPWCTFATDQGSRLIDRFDPVQIKKLIEYMEPKTWKIKVKRQQQDAEWVQNVFNHAEIK